MRTTQRLSIAGLDQLIATLVAASRQLAELTEQLQQLTIRIDLPGIDAAQLELDYSGDGIVLRRRSLPLQADTGGIFDRIVAGDSRLQVALGLARRMAQSRDAVLIQGSTGTGKSLFAWAIHRGGSTAEEPFVRVPCGMLNPSGSPVSPVDFFSEAASGTLVLEDVEDLDLKAQEQMLVQLLPATNCRLLTLTCANLDERVQQGLFLAELLDRLRDCHIELPDLCRRGDDIADLARYHCDRLCTCKGLTPKQLAPEFLQLLDIYPWPGNVRELINTLDQSLMAAREQKTLYVKDLPAHIRVQTLKIASARKKGL